MEPSYHGTRHSYNWGQDTVRQAGVFASVGNIIPSIVAKLQPSSIVYVILMRISCFGTHDQGYVEVGL